VVPLATALGYELGARTRQFDRLDGARRALWRLTLGQRARVLRGRGHRRASPASNRWGIDFELRYQILRWLTATTTSPGSGPGSTRAASCPWAAPICS